MKFTLTFTATDDDNDFEDYLDDLWYKDDDAARNADRLMERFVDGAIITLQFDTEDGSCRVLRTDEDTVDDWVPKKDVVAVINKTQDYAAQQEAVTAELQRQLDEATDALAKEQDRATPYAMNLIRFIMDTRAELRLHVTPLEFENEFEEQDED